MFTSKRYKNTALIASAFALVVGCSSQGYKSLVESADRFANGPGQEWVDSVPDEDKELKKDRINRLKIFKSVIQSARKDSQ